MSEKGEHATSLGNSSTITIRIKASDLLKPSEPELPDFSQSLLSPDLRWKLSRQISFSGVFWMDHEGEVLSIPHPTEWATDDAHHGVFAVTDDGNIMAWVEYPREERREGQRAMVIGGPEQSTEIHIVDLAGRIRRKAKLPPALLLDIEGWGSTKGNFVICRRVGEGRPLCLFEIQTARKLFDVAVPYAYPVEDAFVDEKERRVWLARTSPGDVSRGPFEVGLDYAGQVRELRGKGKTYSRVASIPTPRELPKKVADYESGVVQRFYEGIEHSRAIGRDRFQSREGLRFEAKMLRQRLRNGQLDSLSVHLDRISYLTEGVEGPSLTASEAGYFIRRADELDRLGDRSPKANEVSQRLRDLASASRAYQRKLKQRKSMEEVPAESVLPSTKRLIDYMWETGEGVERVSATDLKKMMKTLGVRVPSGVRADQARDLALQGPPQLRELVARHLAIAIDKPQDWYLRPLQLDPSPLEVLHEAFDYHPVFPSEGLSRGRAEIYHCQGYLVDSEGRKVFLGFGRNHNPDYKTKELVIDGCTWLKGRTGGGLGGGYSFVHSVPRVTFWRRSVDNDAPEVNDEYETLFINFMDKVKSLGYVEDPDEERPIRIPSWRFGIAVRFEVDGNENENSTV